MCKMFDSKLSELRVTQAYINLLRVPEGKSGEKSVPLARLGEFEVRLVELSQSDAEDAPPLWVELYAHNVQSSVDSCGCHELEEVVAAAQQLISQARELNEAATY